MSTKRYTPRELRNTASAFEPTSRVAAMLRQAAEDCEDAERYRLLRSLLYQQWTTVGEAEIGMRVFGQCPSESDIDEAIDRARTQEQAK